MPEPRGKLDTSVNGPAGSGSAFDGNAWEQVDWREHEQRVRTAVRQDFQGGQERGSRWANSATRPAQYAGRGGSGEDAERSQAIHARLGVGERV